ncbi:MAG: type II toxin-antitoxin system HicA family toxin [Chloroflexi bacterium]|nr:type II toxin-antitoxin system HicA family toxin [Ardenticatenaceae bacterium]MBL1127127.1 type II toxin-antitoxin system HicA family toxin [Chloroflexota bacterium]NOG33186.1 type II toxin-antitoxin system HicA family toxin [Chloroflexota bacterium]
MGCEYVRPGAGSHQIWWNPTLDRYTTIPDWGSKDIKPGTLRQILRDLGISRQEFGPIK